MTDQPYTKLDAAEDDVVRLLYKRLGARALAGHLPGRTHEAIIQRAKTLRVALRGRRPWTVRDDVTLIRMYKKRSSTEIAEALNRTADAVLERARYLGARKHKPKDPERAR